MTARRPGASLAGAALLVAGLGSAVLIIGLLVRQVAREREKAERSETDERGAVTELATVQHRLREAREEVGRLEADRARRERVVEGELARLRQDLAEAVRERDALRQQYRSAAGERDRATADLLAARRDGESLRNDLARALQRAEEGESRAKALAKDLEETRKRLAEATARTAALLRPLLQDLRSPDGTLRVRAHEALTAFAGRDLPFRTNGTPEEREADAAAIERTLLAR